MDVLFLAAENGSLPGGKAGGIGDVVRDLPRALAARGCRVTVATPSHGFLHRAPGARKVGSCRFRFRGSPQRADLFEVAPHAACAGVTHLVIDHPELAGHPAGGGGRPRIYTDDPPDRPFYTDASRFAAFCAAGSAAVDTGAVGSFDVLHLHDWHAALAAPLLKGRPGAADGRRPRLVYGIHNLAFQGIRPFRGSASSLEAWFPGMAYDPGVLADPRWPECINMMAVGIRLADKVHTVSPTYAAEIRKPSQSPWFFGGEGLEGDLEAAHRSGRLTGILNGCAYPEAPSERVDFQGLLRIVRQEAVAWSGGADAVPAAQFLAFARALEWGLDHESPDLLLTGVSRVGPQKLLLLASPGGDGRTGLEGVLEAIGPGGRYILLGSGDRGYERFFTEAGARHGNFLFVNGYSDACARALYAAGDLFLMPSSYEPCGLSQMLTMREGQPCLVHAVGGLKDTVRDGHDGFAFAGGSLTEQVDAMVRAARAAALKRRDPAAWQRIRAHAAAARFPWEAAADHYLSDLYR